MSSPMPSSRLWPRCVQSAPVFPLSLTCNVDTTQAGVDYLFTVLGSDHPSIIEAYVRRQKVLKREFPRMVLFQHEVSTE